MTALTGIQTAAVVVMNLDQADAVEVLKSLNEQETEGIVAEIMRMRDLDQQTVADALSQFNRIALGHHLPVKGGRDIATSLLEATYGSEKAAGVMAKVSATGSAFEFLMGLEAAHIASLIDNEQPSMVALVLAHLSDATAAAVLAELPESIRAEVSLAIALMGTASPDAVTIVAETLRARTGTFASSNGVPETIGGVQQLVDIINRSDASVEKALLAELEASDPVLAEDIRSRMFTFADITILEDRDAQVVLRGIDVRVLALALKNASEPVTDVIRRNMTERNREGLDEESNLLGQVRLSQVEEARSEIVRAIRELEATGAITIHRGSEDEYVS
ncbi:flagellar motor switch protein FliG [Microbacterium sp. 77mftsu3.1]|uniref:flagellar motor switch protein FliG n=1 Tax=Microbacterium sp. 77mftsu3.1 TaxID=1761802 RepID=UPI00035F1BA7|nr:flagellar motor switch protein FliG [Microbacterium sp. 77mftsu3.1]SDH36580.1 flagellar motor switch protein FliG [Microbacterium sp. 77mftsu3.1]